MNSKSTIIREYNLAKNRMQDGFDLGYYDRALREAELAAQIATMHPILKGFCDDELENVLHEEYANRFKEISYTGISKNVVFYNSQIANRNALTQQYLDFLIKQNYNILFIVPYHRKTVMGNDILRTISTTENIELYIPKGKDYKSKLENLSNKLNEFRAALSFIHLVPYDVIGFSVFSNLKSSIRYYIVHNDHTFWLGKKCSDFFIEFRKFGINISLLRRKLEKERIVICPYYPIIEEIPFNGFPIEKKNKIVGLIAGNPYKFMMDDDHLLLNSVIDVLKSNDNFILVIAGYYSQKLHDYIEANELKDRVIPIGHRSDFYRVMQNVDIYINSYPLLGGLTTQFAAKAKLPIVTYTEPGLKTTNTAEDLLKKCEIKLTYLSLDSFKERLDDLIKSKELRDEFMKPENIEAFSEDDFDTTLLQIIDGETRGNIAVRNTEMIHDDELFLRYYLQRDHDISKLKKNIIRKLRIEKLFGEIPFLMKIRITKLIKKLRKR